ncbi:restriction endonuclease subunit S [Komagataeibacter oboediens]|uniref:restriction endonuclease subunit S n=1 Tax=Komagataeibacter oboediens TaxID=65958 RepID=UPI0019C82A4D|nr:restriction endonuclease subunit S [Komagataeibacter oboediens]GCE81766.1 type I DNA specificity S subunit [Komagataeibacter oboediens]
MLPKGWAKADFEEIFDFKGGSQPPKSDFSSEKKHNYVRLLQIRDFESDEKAVYIKDLSKWPKCSAEDIMIGRYGASVGKILSGKAGAYNVALVKMIFDSNKIDRKWVKKFLESTHFQEPLKEISRSAQNGFNKNDVKKIHVLLPPLAEQRRIVAKLDSLTACVARARAELERVQVLKVHLRQQTLRSCFADLAKHELPLGELLRGIEAGKNMRCVERPPVAGEKGVVKVSAVTWGHFDTTQTKTLPNDYLPSTKARIMKGDLLISRANTLELVGATVIVDVQPDNIFLSDKILRLLVEEDKKSWVLWYLRSPEGRSQIESLATGNQLSMRNISQAALRQINIPLPTASIRQQRLARLTATIKAEVSLETEAQRALTLLDRLESSLIAKAFRGELVPQDPNDEPASVLLNRIRAERAADTKPKRGRKQSTQDMSLPRKRQTEKHG